MAAIATSRLAGSIEMVPAIRIMGGSLVGGRATLSRSGRAARRLEGVRELGDARLQPRSRRLRLALRRVARDAQRLAVEHLDAREWQRQAHAVPAGEAQARA